MRFLTAAISTRNDGVRGSSPRVGLAVGQHTDEVLGTRLGLDEDGLALLAAEGVTADRPRGAGPAATGSAR
jgi:hypothetical protein